MTVERGDVLVIGAGIIGLSVAFELTLRGRKVTVLESAQVGELAAAGVAAGMIGPAAEANLPHPQLMQLALASRAIYADWVTMIQLASGYDVGFDRRGTLLVALDDGELALLGRVASFHHAHGLDARELSALETRVREPLLAPTVRAGLLMQRDACVDSRLLLRALRQAVERAGSSVIEGVTVSRIVHNPHGLELWTGQDDSKVVYAATQVLASAGAWVGEFGHALPALPLRPVKGQILRLRGQPLIRHVLRTANVYLVPHGNGELLVGASVEEQGFDRRVTAVAVRDLLRDAQVLVPAVAELELVECNVGFRPALADHLPAVGHVGGGLFVSTGSFRSGIALAPILARLLAELMCDGRTDPRIAGLSPFRFDANWPSREQP